MAQLLVVRHHDSVFVIQSSALHFIQRADIVCRRAARECGWTSRQAADDCSHRDRSVSLRAGCVRVRFWQHDFVFGFLCVSSGRFSFDSCPPVFLLAAHGRLSDFYSYQLCFVMGCDDQIFYTELMPNTALEPTAPSFGVDRWDLWFADGFRGRGSAFGR